MSGEAVPVVDARDADADLGAAVDGVLASLLADKDVAEIAAVEGGLIEVIRRGRRERLQALVEGPLFALLRERGAEEALVVFRLAAVLLTAGPLQDGRVALCLKKPAPSDARLDHLVEEGLLPPGIDAELVAAVREGGGVAVIGPARAARSRTVVALARMLIGAQRVIAIGDDTPAGCVPAPKRSGGVVERAEAAVALGADILLGLDLSAADALALAEATLPVPVVAAVGAPSMAGLQAAFGDRPVKSAFALVAVIGFAPDGRPRLVEMHGAVADAPPVAPSAPAEAASSPLVDARAPVVASSRARVATLPGVAVADILAAVGGVGSSPPMNAGLGDAPPADWASSDIDDDPGWELGNLATVPAAPGSFDAALQQVAKRPTYSPKPPPPHPKTASLKGTGGLTLEPPPGSPDSTPGSIDDGGEE